jgi:hypothetical protein
MNAAVSIARMIGILPPRLFSERPPHDVRFGERLQDFDFAVRTVARRPARHWCLERNSEPAVGIDAPVYLPAKLRAGWVAEFSGTSAVLVLAAGTALYVPRGWWHEARSFGDS